MITCVRSRAAASARGVSRLVLLASASALGCGLMPSAASAQEQAASGDNTGEIIVTARRVSESLSKVPVAVSAFNAEQLVERAVLAETDLQRSFAGLTVRTGQSSNLINFSIRGQSIDLFTGSQPGVLPYFNDVQLSSYSTSGFYDLSSIQVLKGPQGTLFGRNATGGAVLFSTGKPTDKLEGSLTGRIGNYDLRQVQGFVNLPVIEDKVLLRVAGDLHRRDGFQYNVLQKVSHGKSDRESGRVSLTLKPTDQLTNDTVFQYSKARGDNLMLQTYNINACGAPGVFSTAACVFSPAVMGAEGYAAYQAAHPGTENMPKARVRGFEFDMAMNPTDWLELGGSLVHTDAQFLKGTTLLFGGLQTYGTYADTPKWAGTLYGAVTAKLGGDMGELVLRTDLYSQTSQWFSNQGTTLAPNAKLPGYTLVKPTCGLGMRSSTTWSAFGNTLSSLLAAEKASRICSPLWRCWPPSSVSCFTSRAWP